jgi:hypothetical protein
LINVDPVEFIETTKISNDSITQKKSVFTHSIEFGLLQQHSTTISSESLRVVAFGHKNDKVLQSSYNLLFTLIN